jgi:hypothetical protein
MTTEELREHVECEVGDAALQRHIDDAEAEIDYRFGSNTSKTEVFTVEHPTKVLYPGKRVSSVTEVVERLETSYVTGYDTTTLSANDYELTNSIRIDRLPTGDNPRTYWGDRVEVTYVPEDKQAQRDGVVIDLVKLALAFDGYSSASLGDFDYDLKDYTATRENILARLSAGDRWWA